MSPHRLLGDHGLNCGLGDLVFRKMERVSMHESWWSKKKKLAKSRLFKAEPLPICKMENDCRNDMTRC